MYQLSSSLPDWTAYQTSLKELNELRTSDWIKLAFSVFEVVFRVDFDAGNRSGNPMRWATYCVFQ